MLLHFARRALSKVTLTTINYFDVFSLEPTFDLDLAELSRIFRQLQAQYHPDKHVNSSALEQEHAAQKSALLNEANKCLKDPYARARLLLKLENVDPNVKTMDMEFLTDMMEFNDRVEISEDTETLTELKRLNEQAITELYNQFREHFALKEWNIAAEQLAKVKFLLQTRERIEQQSELIIPRKPS